LNLKGSEKPCKGPTLIHHQGIICGVACLPESGRRSLLVAAFTALLCLSSSLTLSGLNFKLDKPEKRDKLKDW
jgi:hypothetical protein